MSPRWSQTTEIPNTELYCYLLVVIGRVSISESPKFQTRGFLRLFESPDSSQTILPFRLDIPPLFRSILAFYLTCFVETPLLCTRSVQRYSVWSLCRYIHKPASEAIWGASVTDCYRPQGRSLAPARGVLRQHPHHCVCRYRLAPT